MTYIVYKDGSDNQWHWALEARNKKVVAISAHGYSEQRKCINAIRTIQQDAAIDVEL